MDIIVRGEPHEIDFVRCICRDKVRRGVIAILPATRPASDDVVKLRNERDETTKENEMLKERVTELESRLANVDSNVDTSGDNVDSVPETADSVPNSTETANNDGETGEESTESVPNTTDSASSESNHETPDAMDDKHVDIEDLQEVDLDADDKNLSGDDSKDVPANDAKETTPAKKKSKRSKKSE